MSAANWIPLASFCAVALLGIVGARRDGGTHAMVSTKSHHCVVRAPLYV